ncbi:MAG: hypothetical protein LUF81_06815 [Clostridiales bacterium]|nr:hypothetical protein [Clostridiales bacterium]
MDGLTPGTVVEYSASPWVYLLAGIDAVIAVFSTVMIVVMVRCSKDAKNHLDKYKQKASGK